MEIAPSQSFAAIRIFAGSYTHMAACSFAPGMSPSESQIFRAASYSSMFHSAQASVFRQDASSSFRPS